MAKPTGKKFSEAEYDLKKDYKGFLMKKNAMGIWGKKCVTVNGVKITFADSESDAGVSVDFAGIARAVEGDPLCLAFQSSSESLILKASDPEQAEYWYSLCYHALVQCGKAKPRNAGLPAVDPRNGLTFMDVPLEFGVRRPFLQPGSCGLLLVWTREEVRHERPHGRPAA
jgi:hypothetical protein